MQNFLTHSSWDYRPVMDRVARHADGCIGAEADAGLYIDETAFQKKGDKSVGVPGNGTAVLASRKTAKSACLVHLAKGNRVSLIDARLYLPQEWIDNPARCDDVDIPKAEQVYRTKLELTLQIVHQACQNGVRFEWVGMDGTYGQSLVLLESLQAQGETFLAEIHSDRRIYLKNSGPVCAAPRGTPRITVVAASIDL